MPKNKHPTKPNLEVSKNPAFRTIHANGIFGGLGPLEGFITFYTDVLEPEIDENGELKIGTVKRELQIDVRLTVPDFLKTAQWMNKHIEKLKKMEKTNENPPENTKTE
jgi:hypothetical protein